MSQGTFLDRLIRLKALKRIFVFCPKIDFFLTVRPCFLAKNDQIFKWSFFTCLCPLRSLRVKNSLGNYFKMKITP